MYLNKTLIVLAIFSLSCHQNVPKGKNKTSTQSDRGDTNANVIAASIDKGTRTLVRLSHHINTSANEYFPCLSADKSKIYFSAMDRTGYFDFKLDFTKQRSSGGEDLFYSSLKDGSWDDARPITLLNTNGHEVISQSLFDGSLLVSANYIEKLGPVSSDNAAETSDLFKAIFKNGKYQIFHYPEPVNSIFTEADAITDANETFIMFVSDRPGRVGDFHKKGWKWDNNFWGNTDIFVSLKDGDQWQVPVNLGNIVNTGKAERSPWLSDDGLTLYLSSNGYEKGRTDLNVYAFKRKDKNNWTNWTGPYVVADANSEGDDWGYKEYSDKLAYFSRSTALGFKRTQPTDAGFRESNFRTGYKVTGAQIGSVNSDMTCDIFGLIPSAKPTFVFPDVLFEFNSSKINNSHNSTLLRLVDFCNQNKGLTMVIKGFTDNIGTKEYNLNLSKSRAEAVLHYLSEQGVTMEIQTVGLGSDLPLNNNSNDQLRSLNRRVEVYFK
jgi:outer membrane protein OmpA-like peptidoglycan-associated protein